MRTCAPTHDVDNSEADSDHERLQNAEENNTKERYRGYGSLSAVNHPQAAPGAPVDEPERSGNYDRAEDRLR